jgi:hypothetical protein
LKGTRDWQRYAVVLDVPEASAALDYGLLLSGGGQVWLAGRRSETVGQEVPVTGTRTARSRSRPAGNVASVWQQHRRFSAL